MRLCFFGTPGFAVPSLVKLYETGFDIAGVVTSKQRPKGRGLKVLPSAVKIKAQELGLLVYEPDNPNRQDFYEQLVQIEPEVCVLVAYGYIIKPLLLSLPKKGFINLHPSLLPHYRGAAPINWAIIKGETKTGLTTFLMDERIDAGKIILQKVVEILPEETAGELTNRLAIFGAELLVETLRLIERDNYPTFPQSEQAVILAPKIKDSDRIIDWTRTNYEINNLIRGLSPMPAAYTYFRGRRIEIYCSSLAISPLTANDSRFEPGTIVLPNKDLIVTTGKGLLKITQLKIESKRLITGRDFINGQRIKLGEKFGPPDPETGEGSIRPEQSME